IQADGQYRNRIADIRQLKVRNAKGQMVMLGTLANVEASSGPVLLMRYNMYSASAIYGNATPGTSSGQAIDKMQARCDSVLPSAMASEWTELTYMQLQAGNTAMFVFALA